MVEEREMATHDPDPMVASWADDALGRDDACGLLDRLARGDVCPTELREAAVARAHAVNDRLNAVTSWVSDTPKGQSESLGPFAGIPTVIKDNEALAGTPTSQGSWALPDIPAAASSPFVDQLLSMGLRPIAKTTLPEFGLTATTESTRFGATGNPWNPHFSAGGSSGGSAALVAAGVVPLGHSNDGGGSTRIPAACCGLVGLKPSRGRLVDRPFLRYLPVRLSTQGVLTRSVRDTARYYAIAERYYRDPALPPIGLVRGPSRQRLRVGVLLTGMRDIPVSEEVLTGVRHAAQVCEGLGHWVEEVLPPAPDMFGPDFLTYWSLLALALKVGGLAVFGPGFDPRRTERLTDGLARLALAQADRVPGALRRLRRLALDHEDVFTTHDVLLSAVVGHQPPSLGYLAPDADVPTALARLIRFVCVTPVQNVTGSPALSLPIGRSPTGLPLAVQLAAGFGHERMLLELAFALEQAASSTVQ